MSRSQQRLERKLRRIEKTIKDYEEHLRLLEKRRREIRQELKYPSHKEEPNSFFPLFFNMLFPAAGTLQGFQENLRSLRSALDKALEYLEAASFITELKSLNSQNLQEISPQLLQAISQLNLMHQNSPAKDSEKTLPKNQND